MPVHTSDRVYDEASLYCAAFDFRVDAEVDWLLDLVGPVQSVIEPFCGNARYASTFLSRGAQYTGLDICQSMLDRATPSAGMTLHLADVADFRIQPERPYDLGWSPIDSIRHLSADGQIEAHLACMYQHLRPEAAHVIEIDLMQRDGEATQEPDSKSRWTMPQPDGSLIEAMVYAERYDAHRQQMYERSIYRRLDEHGRVTTEANQLHLMRMVSWNAIERAALDAGFAIEAVYAHQAKNARPRVDPGPHLENTGRNHYIVLRR